MAIHPAFAGRLPLIAGFPAPITEISDPGHLQRWEQFCSPLGDYVPPDVRVEEALTGGAAGRPVRVLLYRPREAMGEGCLVWAHGGGFSGGSTDMFEADGFARELAARTRSLVVSVDYRLAGEGCHHPLPSDDVRAAWRWTRDNAPTLGVKADRVSLGGASAGAALAAGVTVRLLRAGDPLPAALVLAYPLVHPFLPPLSTDVRRALREVPVALDFSVLEAAGENPVVERYLGAPAATARGDSMAALADVTGFPPTVILTAEYDALRASGEAFAAQLALAGTDVMLHQSRGLLHGFLDQPPVIAPIEHAYQVLVGALEVLGRDAS